MKFIIISLLYSTVFLARAFITHRSVFNTKIGSKCSALYSSAASTPEKSNFLNNKLVRELKESYGSPIYVYDENSLVSQATKALSFPNAFGLTVRYAMKASPNAAILHIFKSLNVNFDASSGYEIERAVKAGVSPSSISLSSQELPHNFKELIESGIEFNACSLNQLESFGVSLSTSNANLV